MEESTPKKPISFPVLLLLALLGMLLFSLLMYFTGWGAEWQKDTYEEERARKRVAAHDQLRSEAVMRLSTVGWVNEAEGMVHLPLGQAIELTLLELATKPVTASDVPVALPTALPADAPADAEEEAAPGEEEENGVSAEELQEVVEESAVVEEESEEVEVEG